MCALSQITMPTKWYNVRRGSFYLVQVEKEATFTPPTDLHFTVVPKPKRSASTPLKRGAKISKLRKLVETASRHYPSTATAARRRTTPTATLPQVSQPPSSQYGRAPFSNVITAEAEVTVPDFILEAEEEAEEEREEDENQDINNDETVMYTLGDDGRGTTTAHEDLPKELKEIDKIARKLFKGHRAYTHFFMEAGRVDSNNELIEMLNNLMKKKIPLIVSKLKKEKTANGGKGPDVIFSYDNLTMKTTIALPADTMLVIPEFLSLQLGLEGKVHLGRRSRPTMVTDVNFRNHSVYVYTDIVKNTVVGDTEAPLLRCISVKNQSPEAMVTEDFAHLTFLPMNTSNFQEVTIYLRDSTGQPIPFDYGGVVVVLTLRPFTPGYSTLV